MKDLPLTLTSDADEDRCRFNDCDDALFDRDAFCVKAEERLKGNDSSILLKKSLLSLSLYL